MIWRPVMLHGVATLRAEGLPINYTAKPEWQPILRLQVHRISHARPITLHQHPAWLCSHIFCHTNSNINAFHSHWTIIFTRQVVKTNRSIKFNDQIIMKSGYSNPTRSKKEKYQLTTMFCGPNLTKWWVIFFPFLTSQNTSNVRSSLVINSCSWTHHLKVGSPENHDQ